MLGKNHRGHKDRREKRKGRMQKADSVLSVVKKELIDKGN
jgi:hypothetical protein